MYYALLRGLYSSKRVQADGMGMLTIRPGACPQSSFAGARARFVRPPLAVRTEKMRTQALLGSFQGMIGIDSDLGAVA